MSTTRLRITFTKRGTTISIPELNSHITIFSYNIYRIAKAIELITNMDARECMRYARTAFKWWKAKAFRTPFSITFNLH